MMFREANPASPPHKNRSEKTEEKTSKTGGEVYERVSMSPFQVKRSVASNQTGGEINKLDSGNVPTSTAPGMKGHTKARLHPYL
jgi:hypothetical protein